MVSCGDPIMVIKMTGYAAASQRPYNTPEPEAQKIFWKEKHIK